MKRGKEGVMQALDDDQLGALIRREGSRHVVVDHVLGVVGQFLLGAGDRVVGLVVLDDEHLVGRELDRIVRHRLDEGRGLVVGREHGLVQRGDAGFGFAGGDGPGFVGGQRVGGHCRQEQQRRRAGTDWAQ